MLAEGAGFIRVVGEGPAGVGAFEQRLNGVKLRTTGLCLEGQCGLRAACMGVSKVPPHTEISVSH